MWRKTCIKTTLEKEGNVNKCYTKKSTLKQNTAQSQLSPAAGGAVYLCHRSRVTVVGTAQDDIAVRLYAGLFWNDTQWFSHQRDVCETTMTHTHTHPGGLMAGNALCHCGRNPRRQELGSVSWKPNTTTVNVRI